MGDKAGMATHPPVSEAELSSLKALSFRDYLKSELRRGYLLENDEERYTARREKVYTFFKIPREIEKFVAYGFFQCADSFFFVFTFLPIRFTLAIWSLLTRPVRKVFGLYFSKNRRILKPAEIVDLLKGVMVLVCCYLMGYIDTSVCYHIIKTQSTIKLYLFFNMLEIADRLMSAFGQDTLDALFWTATEPRGRKREHFGVLFHLLVAIAYVALHSTIVLLQALTLNVAINSDNKGLLTIVISNNFVELKGAVFKKFDRNNLLQISCSDVRERFHNCVLLLVVVIQTMKEYAWKEERLWILLPDCLLVCGTEILVDWLKHAFITRFNDIPADAYKDYTVLLASDLIMCKQKYAYSDHSDLVARRMGFIPLPLGVVMYRILSQSIRLTSPGSYLVLAVGFLCLLSFRVLNGIIILGKACDLIEGAEKRRARMESTSDNTEKSSKVSEKGNASSAGSKETLKVEVATSPIRGWSMPPQTLASGERVQVKRQSLEVSTSVSASTSIVSTPSPSDLHVRSNSLDFLGESKKGLMANSMVNLSSVGINEGPFTHDASRQYRLQHSLESIVSADNSDGGESGSELQSSMTQTPQNNVISQTEQAERIQTVSPVPSAPREEQGSGMEGAALNVSSEAQKCKRYPFVSCDSLRYRGSTDGDIL
ncbi:transmembrane anterior posterior transformation protein 1 homolog [Eriocheir sinensis]|uniref:transmembrane anterior posterior transformation protein 1 homolog n=1 Tax=Eriocheir sinensis TaxID=95602 RepID=UPI0021C6B849|nr:transmembrane anterior posterior transformation protein 1 homolog [Eriocheir sinensis]